MAIKLSHIQLLALACAAAATLTLLLLVLLLAGPLSHGAETAATSSSYAVTVDGSQVYGAGVKSSQSAPAKTKNAALVRDPEEKYASPEASRAKLHKKAGMPAASTTSHPVAGAMSTAEVKKALHQEKLNLKHGDDTRTTLASDGSAIPPLGAPPVVDRVIAAGNNIKNFPYIWGGGHGSFQDVGYDCSGSVSYALAGGGLLNTPLTSGALANWGEPGPGKWITIYANGGHVFMIVGGLRFDTSFRDGPRGTRWQEAKRQMAGFEVRHPAGL